MIITIDGLIATGKSTIARQLAQEIGYIYFDTGAMYRCITYGLLKNKIDVDNVEQLEKYLNTCHLEIKTRRGEKTYLIDHEDITNAIRGEQVTSFVSKVASLPQVRHKLVSMQRELANGVNAVFEGRDMGTVVFPNAQLKIFLTGRPDVRAKRRFDELKAKFPEESVHLTLEKTLQEINDRDTADMQREFSPLRQPEDACVIDTSDLTIDEVVLKILEFKDTMKTRFRPT